MPVDRGVLVQGLESLTALARRTDVDRNDVLAAAEILVRLARNPHVICLDVNHNGDNGVTCTNPSCFNYERRA